MKTYKPNSFIASSGVATISKTPLFSNHWALSSSVISKYTGNTRFASNARSGKRSQSRSPSNVRSPKETKHVSLYKRHSKGVITRTRTPTLGNIESFDHVTNSSKNEQSKRQQRDRKSIRTRGRDFQSKPEIIQESSPSKSPSPKKAKSPKIK